MFCQKCGEMFDGDQELCPNCAYEEESAASWRENQIASDEAVKAGCASLFLTAFLVFVLMFATGAFVVTMSLGQLDSEAVATNIIKSIDLNEIKDEDNQSMAQAFVKEAIGEDVDAEKVERFMEEFEYEEFAGEVLAGYIGVATGQRDEFVIEAEDVVKLFEDNEKLIESELEIEMTDEVYATIGEFAADLESGAQELVSDSVVKDEDMIAVRDIFAPVASDTAVAISVAALIVIFIALVFVYAKIGRIHKGLAVYGWPLGIYSAIGYFGIKAFAKALAETEEAYMSEFIKAIMSPFSNNCLILIVIALALIAISFIISAFKKSQKKQEMFN